MLIPSKIRRFFKRFWKMLTFAGSLVAILLLPSRVEQIPAAYRNWVTLMPSRELLLAFFGIAALMYIVWIDIRPTIYAWWSKQEAREKPALKLHFEGKSPWIVDLATSILFSDTDGQPPVRGPSHWCLVEVRNLHEGTIAHKCRVYLRGIEFKPDEKSPFVEAPFGASETLRWSKATSEEFSPRDISHSERHFADVFSTDPFYNRVLLKWKQNWQEYEGILARTGIYRLTIGASSEDAGSDELKLILRWNGKWNEAEARMESL